jgi:hypothetical protein
VKIARNGTGRRCNSFEADLWARTTARPRAMLCPVLARLPFGLAVVMPRAVPLSEDEADHLRATDGFPDWDYLPPDEGAPFEYIDNRLKTLLDALRMPNTAEAQQAKIDRGDDDPIHCLLQDDALVTKSKRGNRSTIASCSCR